MSKVSYRTFLRAKGFKPVPPPHKMRSSLTVQAETIDATRSAMQERAA